MAKIQTVDCSCFNEKTKTKSKAIFVGVKEKKLIYWCNKCLKQFEVSI
jgi:hypothetical protein